MFSMILPASASSYSEDERTEAVQEVMMPQAAPEASEASEEAGSSRPRIAVVDDDIDIANYVKVLLSPNYNVTVYFDGDSALKGMTEETPNLIISDVVMPGMSGYELCKAVKGELQLSHIPVVLVTAKVAVENQVEGLGVGADAYVTKPFQPAYLLGLRLPNLPQTPFGLLIILHPKTLVLLLFGLHHRFFKHHSFLPLRAQRAKTIH